MKQEEFYKLIKKLKFDIKDVDQSLKHYLTAQQGGSTINGITIDRAGNSLA